MVCSMLRSLCVPILLFSCSRVFAQGAETTLQKVVATERAANANDHANWIYLEESRKPKEQIVQWVGSTQKGAVERVLRKDGERTGEPEQRKSMDQFLRDDRAQKKQVAENAHDLKQIDDFLKLLPEAFVWKQTGLTATSTTLHFEPTRSSIHRHGNRACSARCRAILCTTTSTCGYAA